MSIEIHQTDVIRLILQFLKESNLPMAFKALQEESQISLNLVDSKETFAQDIKLGHWEKVLKTVSTLKLPSHKLMDLYEQILLELLELSELEFALYFFQETILLNGLQLEFPEKTQFLEKLLRKGGFDYREIYRGSSKEKNRAKIAESLIEDLLTVPPSRLLTLLSQALKQQESHGELRPNIKFDIFSNKLPEIQDYNPETPSTLSKKLTFSANSRIDAFEFSPNGQHLIIGAADGIIEVWDPIEAKVLKSLSYQAEETYMLHEHGVTALSISKDSELLASGDRKGGVKVWRILSGKCLRRFDNNGGMVGYINFGKESSHLIVAGLEIKVFGLKSQRIIKEFRGHTGLVNDVVMRGDRVISGGKDGMIRIWDWNSLECVMNFKIDPENHGLEIEISNILEFKETGNIVVCNRSEWVFIINWQGVVIKRIKIEKKTAILCGCLSLHAKYNEKGWIYVVGNDKVLYCIDYASGNVESSLKFAEKNEVEIMAIRHHPNRNLLVLNSFNGVVLYLTP